MSPIIIASAESDTATDAVPVINAAMRVACQLDQAVIRVTQLHDLMQQAATLAANNGVTPDLQNLRRLTDQVERLREPLNWLWYMCGEK